jgi:hypothetical protein
VVRLVRAILGDERRTYAEWKSCAERGALHMKWVRRFFDLYSRNKTPYGEAQAADDYQIAAWRQVVVYLGCALGIVVGPYALDAASGHYTSFSVMFGSLIHLFWAALFGFVLTAVLFKTVLSATTPLLVQIGAAIAAGFASGKLVPKAIDILTSGVNGAGPT